MDEGTVQGGSEVLQTFERGGGGMAHKRGLINFFRRWG